MIDKYIKFWNKLTDNEKSMIQTNSSVLKFHKGEIVDTIKYNGFYIVKSGLLNVFTITNNEKEISLFKLREYDLCLFSSKCLLNKFDYEILIEADKDSEIYFIPNNIFESLMNSSLEINKYVNDLLIMRFSDSIWIIDQIINNKLLNRICAYLWNIYEIENKTIIHITHDKIAKDLNTKREVITRVLNYMSQEEMIKINRGVIEIVDIDKIKLYI